MSQSSIFPQPSANRFASTTRVYQVYAARFSDRSSCRNFLQGYAQDNPESYCVFGSSNPNASPDRFYAN